MLEQKLMRKRIALAALFALVLLYLLIVAKDLFAGFWPEASRDNRLLLIKTTGTAKDFQFTFDSQHLAIRESATSIAIHTIKDNSVIRRFGVDDARVHYIALHPSKPWLAANASDGLIWLWDYETGEVLNTFAARLKWVGPLTFSPNGEYLAAVGEDEQQTRLSEIAVWQLSDFRLIQQISRADTVTTLVFSHDSKNLIVDNPDEIVSVFAGEFVNTLTTNFPIWYLRASRDAPYLIAIQEHEVVLLEQTGKYLKTIAARENTICTAAISDDGRLIATAPCQPTAEHRYTRSEQSIQIRNRTDGDLLQSIDIAVPDADALTFSPDGSMLAFISPLYGGITVWRVAPDTAAP